MVLIVFVALMIRHLPMREKTVILTHTAVWRAEESRIFGSIKMHLIGILESHPYV